MQATILHAKSITVADSTNTDMVRPIDWNSAHAAAIALTNTDCVISLAAGGSAVSTGVVSFGNSNGVSFGLSSNSLTMSALAGVSDDREILFGGHMAGLRSFSSYTTQQGATNSSGYLWASPTYLSTTRAVSACFLAFGFSNATSYGVENKGSRQFGIYTSSAGTLSTIWSGSYEWELVADLGLFNGVSFTSGASSWGTYTITAGKSRWYWLSIPMALTLPAGSLWFGQQSQWLAEKATLYIPGITDPLVPSAGIVLGQSGSTAVPDPAGAITATVTGTVLPGSLTAYGSVSGGGFIPFARVR